MSPFMKGLVIAVIHLCLVSTLGAKLLYDRRTLPKIWIRTIPYDPDLPIRGRYVRLQLVVEPHGLEGPRPYQKWQSSQAAVLRIEGDRLVAAGKQQVHSDGSPRLHVRYREIGEEWVAALSEPVAYFIPEGIADPSLRPPGEQLWVEATIPKKGMPRPIRLGVRKGSEPIVPLNIQ